MEQRIWRLEWNDSLSVGIPEVDKEHQNFIALVNGLNQAITERMALDEIRQRMQLLLDDAAQHFAHEEKLFRQWHYPNTDEHRKKHEEVTLKLGEIMAGFNNRTLEYEWIEAGLKVRDMLVDHLLTEDMKYRDFYRSSTH